MFFPIGRDRKHARILNFEAPWLWAVRSSWHLRGFAGDEISFKRATLDLLLQNRVDLKRQVWLRLTEHLPVCGVQEHVLQVREETVGKNIAEAIYASLRLMCNGEFWLREGNRVTIHALVWMDSMHRAGHWGPGEYGPPSVYVGEAVTIVKPPKGSTFEELLKEVKRIGLAASSQL